MTQTSRPWQSTTPGDAGPYSASDWQVLYQKIIGLGLGRVNAGVLLGSGTQPFDPLKVQAQGTPSASIDVLAGSATVQGIAYINTATVAFVIAANASGNPRIDTVILQADYALQTVRLAVLQGTPAASPVAPTLTQTANTLWEIPLADIAVANGFATITNANITRRYEWSNAADGVYLDSVLNNSGGTLEDGDVVVWDASADRAVTTTTTYDDVLLAGVWRGRTAAAGYGRVQVRGIGYVNGDASITRGDALVTSATTKKAGVDNRAIIGTVLGFALETTSGSGYVLARINIYKTYMNAGYQPYAGAIGDNPAALVTANNLAANGGTLVYPFIITGPMRLQSVSLRNLDTANPRSWTWAIYQDLHNITDAIARIAVASGSDAFTPTVASTRTLAASGAPFYLPPGSYWIAIQNNHATNTFNIGMAAAAGFITRSITKTLTPGLGTTLDIVAATWVTSTSLSSAYMQGLYGNGAGPWL